MNAKRILDVARQSGDASLGQTLLRLARLAEANHRFEIAAGFNERVHDDARRPMTATDVSGRIDGINAPVVRQGCKDAAPMLQAAPRSSSVCTEVNR